MNESSEINPYASPTYGNESPVSATVNPLTSIALLGTLRSFRTMMHIVGGIWIAYAVVICVGVLWLVTNVGAPKSDDGFGFVINLMVGVAVLWLTLGLFACFKHIWAVYVGLVLSYLSGLANLVQLNLCGLILVVPTIILAHIAIAKASQLRRAGIPYNSKPGSLAVAGKVPSDDLNFDFLDKGN